MLKTVNAFNTLNSIIGKLRSEGFVHTFSIIKDQLCCTGPTKLYKPAEITVINKNSYNKHPYGSPGAFVYALETSDGYRGILINRRGIYADEAIERFIQKASIKSIKKK